MKDSYKKIKRSIVQQDDGKVKVKMTVEHMNYGEEMENSSEFVSLLADFRDSLERAGFETVKRG